MIIDAGESKEKIFEKFKLKQISTNSSLLNDKSSNLR
jgi:hypothetical protein